jgi:hypothetical protein
MNLMICQHHFWYQSGKMTRRGRGRAGLAQMRRDMQNLQRQVADPTSMLASQRIIQREESDEETNQGNIDQHIEHEEEHE